MTRQELYYITQNFGGVNFGKLIILARRMLANLQWPTLATLVNLEFGRMKYWQMAFVLPNLLSFSPPKFRTIRYYT